MSKLDDASTISGPLPVGPIHSGAVAASSHASNHASNQASNHTAQAVAARRPGSAGATATLPRQNAAILQASLDVSLETKNQPLALLLKAAIAGINELLAPEFGADAIAAAAAQDHTPAATAGRIVALSTGFLAAYRQQRADADSGTGGAGEADTVLSGFMETIRRGFEQGAREAQAILAGMGVLGGDIAANIELTLKLVRQGYADFEAARRRDIPVTTDKAPAVAAA